IPGEAPSSGLRRTGGLAPVPRRVTARGVCDPLRRAPAAVFLVRRAAALGLFDRWRVFPATAFCVGLTSLVKVPRKRPEKERSPRGSGSGALFCSFCHYIAHFPQKSKPCGAAKAGFRPFGHYIFVAPG